MKNRKTVLLVESFGLYVKLTLKARQSEWANIMFQNLSWVCASDDKTREEGYNFFMVTREKLASAIKCFRAVNVGQTRRGLLVKDKWKESPFYFINVNQRNDTRVMENSAYKTGEYQDVKETWANYKPQAEKYFDKIAA